MPRKSSAALQVVPPVKSSARLQPPGSLGAAERAVWDDIVSTTAVSHWVPSDSYLLAEFVRAVVLAERAGADLAQRGAVLPNDRPNPNLVVQEKQVRALASLAHRLRLAPSTRQDRKRTTNDPRAGFKKPWDDDVRF